MKASGSLKDLASEYGVSYPTIRNRVDTVIERVRQIEKDVARDEKEKEKIRELINTWLRATAAGDLQTVLGLMAEDVVFLLPGQPPPDAPDGRRRAGSAARRAQEPSGRKRNRSRPRQGAT